MTITSGSFAKALWPGINKWYGESYAEFAPEYTDLFAEESDSRAFMEDVGVSGFGLAGLKPEGQPVGYDSSARQGYVNRYTHKTYALAFVLTEEAMEDAQYDISVLGKKDAKALAFSMCQTKEILGANIYNRALTAGYTYGDGVVLGSASHPLVGGGTFSNIPTVASDLSEASIEQACIDIEGFVNNRGLKIAVMARTLHIPKELRFEAIRILKSVLQNDTANNAINAVKQANMFPGGVKVNHYFTDADAWFIRTNCPDGMKYINRRATTFGMDDDFDTSNAKFKASFRCSFGNTDPRGIYVNGGA